MKPALAALIVLGFVSVASATPAGAAVVPWDQAKVHDLARQLVTTTGHLYDAFYRQTPPGVGSGQRPDFYRLKQVIRTLKSDARQLSESLEKGEGYDETLPVYEDLMRKVREARELGAHIFATEDLKQKATTARDLLNQLGPYYDPEFQKLEPVTR